MLIEIDDALTAEVPADELLLEFAIWMYQSGKLTKVQARQLARRERVDFDMLLAERGLGVELTEESYREDLQALNRFAR